MSVDEVRLGDDRLQLTPCEMRLLHSVAAMAPAPVRRSAVRERLSDAETSDNIVSVMICRLRRKLGADMPIETVRGVGLRWIDSAIGEAA
ncbi:winged helix-turn-helix domain-containing protein [Novosphingobium sp. 28-62-57]|uniref:winged helix-turn-helix domain-containing protein n=1 Tax=Novosphingobium sp. 28-62-57 TaxID=1970409 RepID=UPI0025F14CF1|nr:winged helix-turn-helix domain-containing protein [Novosphingobium sp. 28-62-57]